jgi:hypothetical protein
MPSASKTLTQLVFSKSNRGRQRALHARYRCRRSAPVVHRGREIPWREKPSGTLTVSRRRFGRAISHGPGVVRRSAHGAVPLIFRKRITFRGLEILPACPGQVVRGFAGGIAGRRYRLFSPRISARISAASKGGLKLQDCFSAPNWRLCSPLKSRPIIIVCGPIRCGSCV